MKRSKIIKCLGWSLCATPIFSLVSLSSCKQEPKVYKVKITNPGTLVAGGSSVQLDVYVDAPDDTDHSVEWSLLKGTTNATLTPGGLLSPGNVAGTVSVTAKSVVDGSKFDTILVQIDPTPVVVTEVVINGVNEIPAESEPVQFTAEVHSTSGEVSQEVIWSVSVVGDTEAEIDQDGYLTPGTKEGWIQIKATSVANPSISKTKDIEITEAESKLPEITDEEIIDDPIIYECVSSTSSQYFPYQPSGRYFGTIYLFNKQTIPYVEIGEFVEYWMQDWTGLHDYVAEYDTDNKKATITNTYYDGSEPNLATCVIDFNRQELIFQDYDCYKNEDDNYFNPLVSGVGGGEDYYVDVVSEYTAPTHPYVIDLSQYHINAFWDDEKHEGYLPYYVFTNILESYSKYDLFFDGENFYELPCGLWSAWDTVLAYDMVDFAHAPIVNADYMEFCYNLLALTLDVKFGLLERPSRGRPGTTIKYFENGAYAAMEPFHDALTSLEPNTSNSAIRELFNAACDDGGHAGYSTVNLLSQSPLSGEGRGPETAYTSDISSIMSAARQVMGHNLPSDTIGQVEVESTTEGANDIAWVTMDSFSYPSGNEKINYDDVNETNYMYDTISLTMYLQKVVTDEDLNIKHVVLDLTNNGGGTVCTEHILASYLCGGRNTYSQPSENEKVQVDNGGVTESIYNPHTGAYTKYTVYADINGDGYYTEDDCLPEGVDLWCITSNYSFSCGNMLPCNLADCSQGCGFIGDRSGGGACFVDSNVNMGFGNVFRGSSTFHMLKNASTPENPISVEEGVIPVGDYFIRNTYQNATLFFDRDYLIDLILGE